MIGVIHLDALPGAPNFAGDYPAIVDKAIKEAGVLEKGGAVGIMIENFGDVPFYPTNVPKETLTCMATLGTKIKEQVSIPIGFNVLRNDAESALALSLSCGGKFVRINVLSGAMATDQGIIEGKAHEVLRMRKRLAKDVVILADVHVKHATPMGDEDIGQVSIDTIKRGGADAIIVTGTGTGEETDLIDLKLVREANPDAFIYVGSGTSLDNIDQLAKYADGYIIGTALKSDSNLDLEKVKSFSSKIKELYPTS